MKPLVLPFRRRRLIGLVSIVVFVYIFLKFSLDFKSIVFGTLRSNEVSYRTFVFRQFLVVI